MFLSRRGHTPSVILMVVGLALCITALVAFASFNRSFEANSQDISESVAEATFTQQVLLTSAQLLAQDAIAR